MKGYVEQETFFNELENMSKAITQEMQAFRDGLDSVQARFDERIDEAFDLIDESRSVKSSKDVTLTDNDELTDEEADEEAKTLMEKIEELEEQFLDQANSVSSHQVNIDEIESDLVNVRENEIADLDYRMDKAEEDLDELKHELKKTDDHVEHLFGDLQGQISDVSQDCFELYGDRQEFKQDQERLGELESQVKSIDSTSCNNSDEIEDLKSENRELQVDFERLADKFSDFSSWLENLEDSIKDLEFKVSQNTACLETLEDKVEVQNG